MNNDKKIYTPPTIVEYGDIISLTQNQVGPQEDGLGSLAGQV